MNDPIEKQAVPVVDDTPADIQVLMETLKDDYRIVAAVNGERAFQLAISDPPPDIILLDVMMPEMDGDEVCARLKADAKTRIQQAVLSCDSHYISAFSPIFRYWQEIPRSVFSTFR